MATPSSRRHSSAAWRMAVNESRLQHRGPPMSPMAWRAAAVARLARPQLSPARGVAPAATLKKIPALTAAPQQPQKPQAPPGTCSPRRASSARAEERSTWPPLLR